MGTEIIVNTTGRETRVAVMDDGRLAEIHIDRGSAESYVGNVYIGRVVRGVELARVGILGLVDGCARALGVSLERRHLGVLPLLGDEDRLLPLVQLLVHLHRLLHQALLQQQLLGNLRERHELEVLDAVPRMASLEASLTVESFALRVEFNARVAFNIRVVRIVRVARAHTRRAFRERWLRCGLKPPSAFFFFLPPVP